jgi:hypothetical protein
VNWGLRVFKESSGIILMKIQRESMPRIRKTTTSASNQQGKAAFSRPSHPCAHKWYPKPGILTISGAGRCGIPGQKKCSVTRHSSHY